MANASRRKSLAGLLVLTAALLAANLVLYPPGPLTAQTGDKKDPKPKTPVVVDVLAGGGVEQTTSINEAVAKGWKANKLTPADRCSDHEFIRRASLDIIGRIAKPAEIERFLKDPVDKRRSLLIERLLTDTKPHNYAQEYADHFANIWTNLLLTRSAPKLSHDQMHLWLFEEFYKKDTSWEKMVTELLTAKGKTNENGAVNFILMHLGEELPNDPKGENRKANGRFEMVPVTSRTTRLFLGLRTQCVQCHDHPFNPDEWKQSHFWGVNAFFRQVDVGPTGRPMIGITKKGMAAQQYELKDNPVLNIKAVVPYERRNGTLLYTKPVFVDGQKLPAKHENRRVELAKFVTKNEHFAKAFVNRTWGHFFGRSFTKEADDFGVLTQVSHPALLDQLAKDFIKYDYDPRMLIRWITNSRAYGLASVANPTNDTPDAEPFFSRMLLKMMSPEQLFDSLMTATDAKAGKAPEDKKRMREEWLNKLIVNFGDDEGNEGSFNGTVVQALLMMNGKELNAAISDKDSGTLAAIIKKRGLLPAGAKLVVSDLFLHTLNRPATDKELKRILDPQRMQILGPPDPKTGKRYPVPMDANFYRAFYQDVFWALLNSNEFILNH